MSNSQKQVKTKYVLMVLQDDISKQQEALYLLQKLSKPQDNIYMSEDDVVQKHIQEVQKKYLNFLKETESQYKQTIKQIKSQKVSSHLYKIKQIVKRITVEGEHTCLMLLKHDQSTNNQDLSQLCLEIIPIMNAPYQK